MLFFFEDVGGKSVRKFHNYFFFSSISHAHTPTWCERERKRGGKVNNEKCEGEIPFSCGQWKSIEFIYQQQQQVRVYFVQREQWMELHDNYNLFP